MTELATVRAVDPTAEELRAAFDAQRSAFARGAPDYRRRMRALTDLRDALRAHEDELIAAISADYGGRAAEETLLLELLPLYDEIRHARRHLRSWMKRRRVKPTWFLMPSRAFVMYQPLGVVGVIGAWNYQLLLTLSPLIDAIAAGNHVILKPSEITPRSAQLVAQLIAERFPADYVTVVTGPAHVGAAFSALPFDHLIFTGSTRLGPVVMRAASENLTPVTLELGGKSPAIVHPTFSLSLALRRILIGKLYNAGQTCVAPDYLMVPHGSEADVEREARRIVAELYPRLVDNPDYTRIVTGSHYQRLRAALDEASDHGARVVEVNPADERCSLENKVFAPTLVFRPPLDAAVMRDELFGPVLPVVTYRSLDEAIAFVNARPRPLALFYFDEDRGRIDDVLERTISGGVLVNDVVVHLGQHNLPFGGVGTSGMGHYHGYAGFLTFSKQKGVMVQRRWTATSLFAPPYGATARKLIYRVLKLAGRP
ncbi:MAG TPA: coniferyl aldehyde dehydrogenase [Gemmatimonadaceae bacterium]